jgi:hypothetical protein
MLVDLRHELKVYSLFCDSPGSREGGRMWCKARCLGVVGAGESCVGGAGMPEGRRCGLRVVNRSCRISWEACGYAFSLPALLVVPH